MKTKYTQEDKEFKALLDSKLPKPGENIWFTRKVINRLPERKHNYAWIEHLAYLLCGIVCAIYWKDFIGDFKFTVITVGELLKYAALVGTTFALVFAAVYRVILKD